MLPLEGGQRAMHNDGSPVGVDDVVLTPLVGAVLPGLGCEGENEEQNQRKDDASQEKIP